MSRHNGKLVFYKVNYNKRVSQDFQLLFVAKTNYKNSRETGPLNVLYFSTVPLPDGLLSVGRTGVRHHSRQQEHHSGL